jgi:capsular polysaccharide biosynthesis protein
MKRENLAGLVRRFGLVVLLTLIGGIAGGIYGAVKTPTYTAQAYVVVTGEAGESIAALNYAQAYGRIATKGPVADKAAAALGSTEDLKRVSASTSPDAPVIEITATGPDAERTATVANAVAKALVDVGTSRKAETRVGVSVLASASVPTSPTSPKPPLELAVGAAGGLLIGGLTVLAGVGRPARRGATGAVVPTQIQPAAVAHPQLQATQYGPARYEDTEFDTAPALTTYLTPPAQPAAANQPLTADRIVGRAVVIYREQQ